MKRFKTYKINSVILLIILIKTKIKTMIL